MDFSWPVTPLVSFEGAIARTPDGDIKPVVLHPGRPYFVRERLERWGARGVLECYLLVGVINEPGPDGRELAYPADRFVPYDPPKAEPKRVVRELERQS